VQALVQHTRSTQIPDSHSTLVLQPTPGRFFALHTPPPQYSSLLQSPSERHAPGPPVHKPPLLHLYPVGHVTWPSGGQLPEPLQNATSVAFPFWQSGLRHGTPGPGYVHVRVVVPSQTPPHAVPAPAQPGLPFAGSCPAAIGMHSPS
jgi:hypothetical protein